MIEEIWKPIPGYEKYYEVSNRGNVRSVSYFNSKAKKVIPRILPHILSQEITHDGYHRVVLCKDKIKKHMSVHRLVAMAFHPNPKNLPEVNHINEDTHDNCAENLCWCTGKENSNHGTLPVRMKIWQTNNPKRSKAVVQMSADGVEIASFLSTREAERQTGIACEQISRCCKGRNHHAGGFKWKYKFIEDGNT